ncbi:MAG TPA: RodZ domain-containing protein [bacterium]|nr:RodZ domain-containing protein [bacterium]
MRMTSLGIGERLRTTREARGLSLDEVEASIRIRRRYLDALEAEAFHEIPGPAYVKGFLRTYAVYLGLPAEELVAMYPHHRSGVSRAFPVEVRITPATPHSRLRRIVTGIAVIFGIGVVLLGFMLYGQIRQFAVTSPAASRAGHSSSALPRTPQVQTTAPPAPPAASPAPPHAGPRSPAGASPQAPPSPVPVAPAAPPIPQAPPAATPSAPTTPPASATPTVVEPSVVFPGPLDVVVVANDRTWVRAIADGVTVYDGFVSPGERQAWGAQHQVVIRVGNAGAIDLTVNGHALGRFGNSSGIVERTFTAGTSLSP